MALLMLCGCARRPTSLPLRPRGQPTAGRLHLPQGGGLWPHQSRSSSSGRGSGSRSSLAAATSFWSASPWSRKTPVCDLMFGGGVESLAAYEGCFEPCTPEGVEFLRGVGLSEDNLWTPFSSLPLVLIYNTRLVSEGETDRAGQTCSTRAGKDASRSQTRPCPARATPRR